MARPRKKKSPGTSASPDPRFPSAGSQEEFWRRCEKAAELYVNGGQSYRQIATTFGCSLGMSVKYVKTYLAGAQRYFSAPEIREKIGLAYTHVYRLILRELARLETSTDPTKPRAQVSDEQRIVLRIRLLERAESVQEAYGKLYGLGVPGIEINLPGSGSAPDVLAGLPARQDRDRMRALLRLTRESLEQMKAGKEIHPGELRKMLDASFTEIDDRRTTNGGKEDDDGGTRHGKEPAAGSRDDAASGESGAG